MVAHALRNAQRIEPGNLDVHLAFLVKACEENAIMMHRSPGRVNVKGAGRLERTLGPSLM